MVNLYHSLVVMVTDLDTMFAGHPHIQTLLELSDQAPDIINALLSTSMEKPKV